MIFRNAFALMLIAAAGGAHAADLTVRITDLRAESGVVKVSLVDSAAAWNEEAPRLAAGGARPLDGEATVSFPGLAPGHYAVMVMHDENDNGTLDKNFIGMPTEGYGFSNNPDVMRRATFEEARFAVGDDDHTVTIRVR